MQPCTEITSAVLFDTNNDWSSTTHFPQATKDFWVILADGFFLWRARESGTLWEIWGGSYFPQFPTDRFISFWKRVHEELSRYFYLEDNQTSTRETLNQACRISFHLVANDGQISLCETIVLAILWAFTLHKTTSLKQQQDPNILCLQQHKVSRANKVIFFMKYPAEMTALPFQMFLRSYHRIASTRHIYLNQTLSSLRAIFSWNSLNTLQDFVLFCKGSGIYWQRWSCSSFLPILFYFAFIWKIKVLLTCTKWTI